RLRAHSRAALGRAPRDAPLREQRFELAPRAAAFPFGKLHAVDAAPSCSDGLDDWSGAFDQGKVRRARRHRAHSTPGIAAVTSPATLLDALPLPSQPHLLDPGCPGGWGRALLGAYPEVTFRGGLEALREAERWLAQYRGAPPLSAVLVWSLGYELGQELW